jgi:hypothetical protein
VHRQLVRIDNGKQDAIETTTNTRLKEKKKQTKRRRKRYVYKRGIRSGTGSRNETRRLVSVVVAIVGLR